MYILGSIFASLAFEGSIPHVIFRRKDESSGPRPLSLASRHVRCQSVLGEAASHFRGSRALSPFWSGSPERRDSLAFNSVL